MPTHLYHATSSEIAILVAKNGLQCRSKGNKGDDTLYLCMSAVESGATTLQRKANDVIFRATYADLNSSAWKATGAGEKEWRGTEPIGADKLMYRRYLGSASQKTWREVSVFPEGLS
jgi:hypothetical protein